MKEIMKYPNCFVCGDKNIGGLQAKFYYDGEKAFTNIIADKKFEGYRGIFHGGVISSMLDEVMIKAILAVDKFVVTAELTVKYIHPTKIGDKIIFEGFITKQRGKIFITGGEAKTEDGQILATATGKYIEAKGVLKDKLMKSSDQ